MPWKFMIFQKILQIVTIQNWKNFTQIQTSFFVKMEMDMDGDDYGIKWIYL